MCTETLTEQGGIAKRCSNFSQILSQQRTQSDKIVHNSPA